MKDTTVSTYITPLQILEAWLPPAQSRNGVARDYSSPVPEEYREILISRGYEVDKGGTRLKVDGELIPTLTKWCAGNGVLKVRNNMSWRLEPIGFDEYIKLLTLLIPPPKRGVANKSRGVGKGYLFFADVVTTEPFQTEGLQALHDILDAKGYQFPKNDTLPNWSSNLRRDTIVSMIHLFFPTTWVSLGI